jgi:hypothetical protein
LADDRWNFSSGGGFPRAWGDDLLDQPDRVDVPTEGLLGVERLATRRADVPLLLAHTHEEAGKRRKRCSKRRKISTTTPPTSDETRWSR